MRQSFPVVVLANPPTMYHPRVLPVLLLAAFVALVESSLPSILRGRRSSPDRISPVCEREMDQCGQPYAMRYQAYFHPSVAGQSLANRTLMADVVANLQTVSNCVRNTSALEACGNKTYAFGMFNVVAGYFAEPGAMDTLVAMTTSPCLASEEVLERYIEANVMCLFVFPTRQSDACAGLERVWSCVEGTAETICGSAVGNFVRDFKAYTERDPVDFVAFLNHFSEVDFSTCGQQVVLSRKFVDAGLSMKKLNK